MNWKGFGRKRIHLFICWIRYYTGYQKAVSWPRRLVAGLSRRTPVFAPGPVNVGFVDNVALGQVFLHDLRLSLAVSLHHGSSCSYITREIKRPWPPQTSSSTPAFPRLQLRFRNKSKLYRVGLSAPKPNTPTWRTTVSLSVWVITFDQPFSRCSFVFKHMSNLTYNKKSYCRIESALAV
jgi:hypothetical protein